MAKKKEAWVCPHCKNDDTLTVDVSFEDTVLFITEFCPKCQTSWTESFGLEYRGYFYDKEYSADGEEVTD